jgi:hypothetical protein
MFLLTRVHLTAKIGEVLGFEKSEGREGNEELGENRLLIRKI